MEKRLNSFLCLCFAFACLATGCNNQTKQTETAGASAASNPLANDPVKSYVEGTDYLVYERVRIMDKNGFDQPVEAQSMLLPKGWAYESSIDWIFGTACDGTNGWLKAKSRDGKYSLEFYPNKIYGWDNKGISQYNNSNACQTMQPMDAEPYLRTVFAPDELGNPKVVKVDMNETVVAQMRERNAAGMREMQQNGAGRVNFQQTAINADVSWPDGKEGFVILGVNAMQTEVPNPYDGTTDAFYTTSVSNQIVFKYPKGESEKAKSQFSAILSSIHTNPAWQNAVNSFWRQTRQQRNVAHQERMRVTEEINRSMIRNMGEQAIRRGNERLQQMDLDLRNWETQQSAQDRVHSNFVKTIREVENFKDATGTYEMSSSYNHAWSRGDGNSFVMSDNPNFDPQFVFKDQNWQEMKKVD